jgi:hypothetical protein
MFKLYFCLIFYLIYFDTRLIKTIMGETLNTFENSHFCCIFDIITDDETWIYQFNPDPKRQSAVWCFPDDNLLNEVNPTRSGDNLLQSGYLIIVPLSWCTLCLPDDIEKLLTEPSLKQHWKESGCTFPFTLHTVSITHLWFLSLSHNRKLLTWKAIFYPRKALATFENGVVIIEENSFK